MIKHRAKSIEQRAQETAPTQPSPSRGEGGSLSFGFYALRSEKGIALVMVLILSAIALAVMAGLIYMITAGTQISGMQKRYKTALEAGKGGSDVIYQFIAQKGETSELLSNLSSISPAITTPNTCTGTNISGASFTGWAAKLNTPSTSWSGCDNSLNINTGTSTTYDMRFDIGVNPTYRVYGKVVDAIEGNSGGGESLLTGGVVASNSGEVTVVSRPYLYTIEVDTENLTNPSERSKLSILYQY